MAKFIYKMQNILNIKLKLEDQAKMEFSQAQAMLFAEEEKLAALLERQKAVLLEGARLRENILEPLSLRENTDEQAFVKAAIAAQRICVEKAEQVVEIARAKLQEAMVERKIHEKLRENAFEQFKLEVAKEESKEVDELVSYTYGRKVL